MRRLSLILAFLSFCVINANSQELPSPPALCPSTTGVAAAAPEVVALLAEDPDRCAVTMHVCEFDPILDTKPPRGYKPFYISHYGRHGTRTNSKGDEYIYVIERLEKADSLGILTEEGKSLLSEAKAVLDAFGGRDACLLPRGEREQREIARRMFHRYPEVFRKGSGNVRAQATIVPRCLVSMACFVSELSAHCPRLDFSIISNNKAQKYLANNCTKAHRKEASRMVRPIWEAPVDTVKIVSRLFTDPVAAREAVENVTYFQKMVCETAKMTKNLDLDIDIFRHVDMDVIYQHFDATNRHFYLTQANSVEFGEIRMPPVAVLVDEIARLADEAIRNDNMAADLRFGHDWPFVSIAAYLGLEGIGDRMSVNEIPHKWFGPKYFFLGCNLQMVFYRNRDGHVLVKFLVNEKETLLRGLQPVQGPYYEWSVVRENLDGWRR